MENGANNKDFCEKTVLYGAYTVSGKCTFLTEVLGGLMTATKHLSRQSGASIYDTSRMRNVQGSRTGSLEQFSELV